MKLMPPPVRAPSGHAAAPAFESGKASGFVREASVWTNLAKAQQVAHIRFRAPDLARLGAFLGDFGMDLVEDLPDRIYARGAGAAPFLYAAELDDEAGFAAAGFRFENVEALKQLAALCGLPVEALDAPGGGRVVRLADPDGFVIEAVAGQDLDVPKLPDGDAANRPRPSFVQQMNHVVLAVSDVERSQQWYQSHLGLVTSDEVFADSGEKVAAFLRLDRGDVPSDHHALFIFRRPTGIGFVHAAFDVPDADDLIRGHEHLHDGGHDHYWGIGRHTIGNQIFDYWRDPWGHQLEHCTGGDKFAADVPPGTAEMKALLDVRWGAVNPRLR